MIGRDRTLTIEQPLTLESGEQLERVTIGFRTWGQLNSDASNAVLVCPALTGDRHVDTWWSGLFGPGRSLDPHTDFIVAADVFGGSGATTGPDEAPSSASRFPDVSVRDMVRVQALLIDALRIDRLKLVIGGSLGGMQALEWAVGSADRVESAAIIAAPARQSAWASALNHAQRRALDLHGDLDLARIIAMLSYRHWDNLENRFGADSKSSQSAAQWLDFHGRRLTKRFNPVSYRRLMGAMDSHDVGRNRNGWRTALAATRVDTLVVGIKSDLLYPPRDQIELAEALPLSRLAWLDASHGHDAFLIEQRRLDEIVSAFRRSTAFLQPALEA
ncbi:MAG TPA: homoserine O-acetyltransferase [Wenzhouxiangella sp.]|nr:homoserine O-acetyltransferase [Wenzhouxiangella sp.]